MVVQVLRRHLAAISAIVVFVAFAVAGTVIVGQPAPSTTATTIVSGTRSPAR